MHPPSSETARQAALTWLAPIKTLRDKYYVGEPHDCPMGSAEEMKMRGYVGIYLKEPVTFAATAEF